MWKLVGLAFLWGALNRLYVNLRLCVEICLYSLSNGVLKSFGAGVNAVVNQKKNRADEENEQNYEIPNHVIFRGNIAARKHYKPYRSQNILGGDQRREYYPNGREKKHRSSFF